MDFLKKYLPHAFKAKQTNDFIVSLIIYAAIAIVGGAIIGLLAKLPIIGLIFSIVGAIVDLYALVGIVLSILVFVKVIK